MQGMRLCEQNGGSGTRDAVCCPAGSSQPWWPVGAGAAANPHPAVVESASQPERPRGRTILVYNSNLILQRASFRERMLRKNVRTGESL